jgi:hypothetical protein
VLGGHAGALRLPVWCVDVLDSMVLPDHLPSSQHVLFSCQCPSCRNVHAGGSEMDAICCAVLCCAVLCCCAACRSLMTRLMRWLPTLSRPWGHCGVGSTQSPRPAGASQQLSQPRSVNWYLNALHQVVKGCTMPWPGAWMCCIRLLTAALCLGLMQTIIVGNTPGATVLDVWPAKHSANCM